MDKITWQVPVTGAGGGDGSTYREFVLEGPCGCGCPSCPDGQQLAVEYNYIDVYGKPGLGRSFVQGTEPWTSADGSQTGCKYRIDYGVDCAIQSVFVYCCDPNRPGEPFPVQCDGDC